MYRKRKNQYAVQVFTKPVCSTDLHTEYNTGVEPKQQQLYGKS